MPSRLAAWLCWALAATATAAAPVMTNLNPAGPPSARTGPATTINTAAPETMWLLGGNATLGGTNNQLWSYVVGTNTWAQRTVSGATPSNRAWAVMSWDVGQQRLVLFGGSSALNGPLLSDLRFFDPATNVWTLVTPAAPAPSARFLSRMLYIPHQQRHLLFGGGTSTSANAEATVVTNELWSLTINGAAGTASWTLLTPAGTPPAARASTCMAYDPVRHKVIIYGGELVGSDIGDVLQYDVDTNTWTTDTPTGTSPGVRGAVLCTFDERTRKLVVYGGTSSPSGSPLGGAFTYDPVTQVWTQLSPATTPGGRTSGGSAYSPTTGGMIFFGGRATLISVSNETWSMKVNAPPVLTLPAPFSVNEADPVSLQGSASDLDVADTLSWTWTQTQGPTVTLSSTSVASPAFTAPRVTANTTLGFFANVTDGVEPRDGGVTITVLDTINEPPEVDAGAAFSVNEGQAASLSGSASDPNGEAMTYLWTQLSGPSALITGSTSLSPGFTAPAVTSQQVLVFQLRATDTRAGVTTASVPVTVLDSINEPPTAVAGADQTVDPGQVVALDGTASSDPNGEALAYQWTQQLGPAVVLMGANQAAASFIAPSVPGGTTVSFQLTVTDTRSGTGADAVTFVVRPPVSDGGSSDGGAGGGTGTDAGSGGDGGTGGGDGGTGGDDGGTGGDDGGGFLDGGAGGGSGSDAGVDDGGSSFPDGGRTEPYTLSVGCGCTVADASTPLALLLALLGLRARRRI